MKTIFSIYRGLVSPFFGERCRFYPSCSHYMEEAMTKRGSLVGVAKGILRLLRCHPFHPGGYDPV